MTPPPAVDTGPSPAPPAAATAGRRPATSRRRVVEVAMELFVRLGYEHTSVDEIAAAAGISRRTLFRYFPTKSAIPWGEFSVEIDRMRSHLTGIDRAMPLPDALAEALVAFNTFPESETAVHLERMRLLLDVDELQAHSILMYADWRAAIARFVAERRGESPDDLVPSAVAHATQGIAVSAYRVWIDEAGAGSNPDAGTQSRLHALLRAGCRILAD